MSQQSTQPDVLEESTIIDTDVHVSIHPEELATNLETPHDSRVRNKFCFPRYAGSDYDPSLGGKIEGRLLMKPEQIDDTLRGEFHIDHPLLNPLLSICRLPDPDFAVELMRANNSAFVEKFLDQTDAPGLPLITTQRPDKAAEEIDRLADEDQVVGVLLQSTGPDRPLGNPSYDIIYEAAEDNGLPVVFHAAAATAFKYDFMKQAQGLNQFLEVHTLAHLWSQTLTLTSLLVEGVPEKFSDLDFVFLEAGIGWVPYMMWRLNKEYSIRRSEAPLLQKSPEEYVREQFYFASQPLGEPNDAQQMKEMIDLVSIDNMMFASDYPHWDFDHPNELDKHLKTHFSAEEREQVLEENPAEVFDLKV